MKSLSNDSKVDLAYVAGFIDGEGSFTISWDSANNRAIPRLVIVNTNSYGLLYCKDIIEETLGIEGLNIFWRSRKGKKKVGQLYLDSLNLKRFTKVILPYLKIKREQADLIIRFFNNSNKAVEFFYYMTMSRLNGGQAIKQQLKKEGVSLSEAS